MFKKLICLLKGHKKVKTVYESESNFTNKETAMITKLVGAEPKGNSLERYPEEKAKWVGVRVHCSRCGKELPSLQETAELIRKYRS